MALQSKISEKIGWNQIGGIVNWLDEIEKRMNAEDIPRLVKAVRRMREALQCIDLIDCYELSPNSLSCGARAKNRAREALAEEDEK